MGTLQTDATDSLPDIEELLHGKIVFLLLKPTELTHLGQPFVHFMAIRGKGHLIYLLLTQSTEATILQEFADLIEAKLMFEVIRINHAAKLHNLQEIAEKVCLKFG